MKVSLHRITVVAAVLIALLASACSGASQPAPTAAPAAGANQEPAKGETKELVIAGSQTTGTWFVFAGALSQQISNHIPGYKASPTPSDGSAANILNVQSETIDLGMSLPDVLYEAYSGTGKFADKKVPEIRALYNTYSFPLHVITLPETGVSAITDLKGKKIAIGPPGSTDDRSFQAVLAEYNMSIKEMEIRSLSLDDRVAALKDGQVDAIVVLTGTASGAITELMTTKEGRYLQVSPDVLQKVNAKHPYFVAGTIPKGTYKNLNEDVSTVFTWGVMTASAKMDEKLVYDITRVTFERKDDIVKVIALAKEMNPDDAIKVPVPLHPGAEKYFREIGALK